MTKQYEVENKFSVDDLEAAAQVLRALGASFTAAIEQIDTYFAHPVRDFGQTDEALRLRRVADQNQITYKGPKIDQATKTRAELELPLVAGDERFRQYRELLTQLGFRPVSEVRKRRRRGELLWQATTFEVCLDEVQGLGRFVELEILTDQAGLERAQVQIIRLAEQLGLTSPERRSYLEMLLENRAADTAQNSRLA